MGYQGQAVRLRHRYEFTLYAPVQQVVGRLLSYEAVEACRRLGLRKPNTRE